MQVGNDKRLNYYRLPPEEVIAELNSHKHGLTAPEASRRLGQHGANSLVRYKSESAWVTLLRQFKSLFVFILLLSAAFSLYLNDAKTAIILASIALINTAVGYFQEHNAETLLESLTHLLVPQARVMRSGQVKMIDSQELVLGDVVRIEAGDSVPADLRILEEDELATNDFSLTGESNPVRKFVHAISRDVPLGSRQNLAFMGTTVATGTATGIVVGVGMHTELGRIASLAESTESEDSPLQNEMNTLAKRLTQATAILVLLLTVVAMQADLGLKAALLFAIAIGAAMIPNGLVAEVNITLAQTAGRMAKARALVKKLSAVETLGATNIILTDKTGTLTQNEMTVEEVVIGKSKYRLSGTGYQPEGDVLTPNGKPVSAKVRKDFSLFFETAALASNAKVNEPDSEHAVWYVVGDPTEGALITMARKAGTDIEQLEKERTEIKEFQFDSARKMMSSVRIVGNKTIVYVKGAPEEILERSTTIWDHGHTRRLAAADKKYFSEHNDKQAHAAKRNLAFAYRVYNKKMSLKDLKMDEVESKLTFLGMASMVDPVREQVPKAMIAARGAHVKVSVITGDHAITAKAVAAHAQLAKDAKDIMVVHGEDLLGMHDSQILELVERGSVVFSRVSPEDKLRIVEVAKHSGHVVAVTGDGINDAPALKRADIGVAMGKTGTDVAKESADIILLDDSFNTLVGAIEQGRLTFKNIRKAARCALTDNAGELLLILISLVMNAWLHIPAAITAIQILAIDVVAEMFPITALGWDKASSRKLMHDKPRRLKDHILTNKSAGEFIGFGLLSASLAYLNFLWFFERQGLSARYIDNTSPLYMQASILTFVTMILCQFINLMLVRTDEGEPFFTSYLWSNKKLLAAFGLSFFFILNIVYNPLIQPFLGAQPLSVADWATALLAASVYFGIRLLIRGHHQHTRKAIIDFHHEVHGHHSPARV
ncbi:cation-transporting P-type ATPase [Candidatus Saccharibacteria bacterium]|nr:cation-transporting P-type ATPase [Candidatus Saccharibacteria bacterium]